MTHHKIVFRSYQFAILYYISGLRNFQRNLHVLRVYGSFPVIVHCIVRNSWSIVSLGDLSATKKFSNAQTALYRLPKNSKPSINLSGGYSYWKQHTRQYIVVVHEELPPSG